MITANFHTHTPRCHHAKGSEREYIEQAITNGFITLGFSDHVPQPFKNGYVSTIRMTMEELDDYVGTLRALQKEYADRIQILVGFEAEYYPDLFEELLEQLRKRSIDYLILGQHHAPEEPTGFYSGYPTEDEYRLETYVNQVIAGMQTGVFSYLAHPDLLHYTGEDEIYRKHMRRLCTCAKELDIPLEINMLGFHSNRHYPCDKFFQLAVEEGCRFILGCDAHEPEAVRQPEDEPGMMEFLERNHIQYSQNLEIRKL